MWGQWNLEDQEDKIKNMPYESTTFYTEVKVKEEKSDYGIKISHDHVQKYLNHLQFQLSQLQVCEEECSELIKAISKYIRITQGTTDLTREEVRKMIVEETVHVAICCHMLQAMFDISQEEIDEEVVKKEQLFEKYD